MNRREFLHGMSRGAAGLSALGMTGAWASPARAAVAPSDQIRLGVIGPGNRGKDMMRHFLRVPGVHVAALCDIYEPRFAEGRRVTGESTPVYTDYRRMLEGAHELDAVLIATPLDRHAEHVLGCLDAGLHVYGEKAMAFTVEECDAVVRAVRNSGRRYQVGHQYRYAPWYRQAVERIGRGEIGKVTHIYAYWHRNFNWRRPIPDPSLERLINWRLYHEYSGGLLAELGSHHLDLANWIFDEMPHSAQGSGGIDFYKDGREVLDNIQVLFDYPSGGTLFFSSITGNHRAGFQIQIYGTGGTVELTLQDGFFYYEPKRANSAVPSDSTDEGVVTTPSLSTSSDMPYRGPGLPIEVPAEESADPSFLSAKAFVDSLRQESRPFADEEVGWSSAVPMILGNQAIRSGNRVDFRDMAGVSSGS